VAGLQPFPHQAVRVAGFPGEPHRQIPARAAARLDRRAHLIVLRLLAVQDDPRPPPHDAPSPVARALESAGGGMVLAPSGERPQPSSSLKGMKRTGSPSARVRSSRTSTRPSAQAALRSTPEL